MDILTLIMISLGLAMDAFAVSLAEGLAIKRRNIKHFLLIAGTFGGFQAIMPLIGWRIGRFFSDSLMSYSRIIAFILLFGIGFKMIFEAWKDQKCEEEGICEIKTNYWVLGFATSIDALVVGFAFSLVKDLHLIFSVSIIGVITFILSYVGVYIGYKLGNIINYKVEYFGGAILILMGVKALIK